MTGKKVFIDLFAGAGGLSEGFIRAGFVPVAHVEIDEAAANTLKTRMARHWLFNNNRYDLYEQYLKAQISRNSLWSSVPLEQIESVINRGICAENMSAIFEHIDSLITNNKVDVIIGGPPCQAYSLAGRSRDKNGMKGDSRNYLYEYYAEFLKHYQPQYFVFENVLGLLSAKDQDGTFYISKMIELFRSTGYETEYKILDASDFGIPQKRKRMILVGKLHGKPVYPMPDKVDNAMTINELFADLPAICAGGGTHLPQQYRSDAHKYFADMKLRNAQNVTWHTARPNSKQDLEIYSIVTNKWNSNKLRLNYNDLPDNLKTHTNRKAHLDRFKVVAGDLNFSHTVVAHIAKDGHYYIHPDSKQNRSITPREAARLQTFPDDYYFEGRTEKPSRTSAFKQIGNAVPVLLGEKIAQKLNEVW